MTAQSPSYTLCPPTRPQFSQSGAPSSVSSPRQAQAFPLGWLQGSDRSQRSCYLCPKWRPPSNGPVAGRRCTLLGEKQAPSSLEVHCPPQGSKPDSRQALAAALSPAAWAAAVWSHLTPGLVQRLPAAGGLSCAVHTLRVVHSVPLIRVEFSLPFSPSLFTEATFSTFLNYLLD